MREMKQLIMMKNIGMHSNQKMINFTNLHLHNTCSKLTVLLERASLKIWMLSSGEYDSRII